MTERNQIIEKALQLTNPASKIGKDENHLPSSSAIISHLVAEFPNASESSIRLITTRAIALAMKGHDWRDREMYTESVLSELKVIDSHKKAQDHARE